MRKRRAQAVWNRGRQFVATSGSGHAIVIDTAEEEGGYEAGPSNTELLLMALCGCTGMDVQGILRKKRLDPVDLEVVAEAEATTEPPLHVSRIHLTYRVWGDIPEPALHEAIELSQEKYCTISLTVGARAEIGYEYEILPGEEAPRRRR